MSLWVFILIAYLVPVVLVLLLRLFIEGSYYVRVLFYEEEYNEDIENMRQKDIRKFFSPEKKVLFKIKNYEISINYNLKEIVWGFHKCGCGASKLYIIPCLYLMVVKTVKVEEAIMKGDFAELWKRDYSVSTEFGNIEYGDDGKIVGAEIKSVSLVEPRDD